MSAPYRDPDRTCPACKAPLRAYQGRLVCDACGGMFLALPDLVHAIHELTGVDPVIAYKKEKPGARACPSCGGVMSVCKLGLTIDNATVVARPWLDRCAAHGLWFDRMELAKVFEKVIGKGPGGGYDHKPPKSRVDLARPSMASGGWRGRDGVPEWWGTGGV